MFEDLETLHRQAHTYWHIHIHIALAHPRQKSFISCFSIQFSEWNWIKCIFRPTVLVTNHPLSIICSKSMSASLPFESSLGRNKYTGAGKPETQEPKYLQRLKLFVENQFVMTSFWGRIWDWFNRMLYLLLLLFLF